jgi:hypothetical protein
MIVASTLLMAMAGQGLDLPRAVPALRAVSAEETAAIEGALRAQLADPDAVRFRLLPNITAEGDYCGLVDGKDAYGTYAGYAPFHVRITHEPDGTITVSDILISTDGEIRSRLEAACAGAGLDVRLPR